MKIKNKLIMDAALLVLLIVLMKYSWTGGLIHELLGLITLVGFGIHIFFNRKYYGAMFKAIRNGKATTKGKASFVINTVLLIASCTMLLSDPLKLQPQCFQYVPGFSTLVNRDRLISRHTSTPYITRESSSFKAVLNEIPHPLL